MYQLLIKTKMIQKKKAGRPATRAKSQPTIEKDENNLPEDEKHDSKIEEIEVKQVIPEKVRPIKKRRNLHPVEVNGVVRMLTKFAYNSIRKDQTKEIILPKNSPFNELEDCEGC